MALAELLIPTVPAVGVVLAVTRRIARQDVPDHDRALRLFAGIAAIMARDKRRRKRAMDVLRLLRRDD